MARGVTFPLFSAGRISWRGALHFSDLISDESRSILFFGLVGALHFSVDAYSKCRGTTFFRLGVGGIEEHLGHAVQASPGALVGHPAW